MLVGRLADRYAAPRQNAYGVGVSEDGLPGRHPTFIGHFNLRTAVAGLRYSLRALLGGVVIVAIACAAVAYPSRWWASALFSAVLLLLALATLGAALSRGSARAAFAGFAWLGGVYFVCAFGPGFADHIEPKLPTSRLVGPWSDHLMQAAIKPAVAGAVSLVHQGWDDEDESVWRATFADGSLYQMKTNVGPPSRPSLAAIIHSLTAFVLAILGALLGRWFYEKA